MENTILNKQKFFAQYFGQEVLIRNHKNTIYDGKICNSQYNLSGWESVAVLELTPLHLISDEDAKKLPNRQYDGFTRMYENKEDFLTSLEIMMFLTQEEVDILRSLGYAVNFQDLSVEEQVQRGWVVLKIKI